MRIYVKQNEWRTKWIKCIIAKTLSNVQKNNSNKKLN